MQKFKNIFRSMKKGAIKYLDITIGQYGCSNE